MARDYAPKGRKSPAKPASRKTARQGKRPSPGPAPAPARRQQGSLSVRWILALAAVGGFIGFIFYLNSLPPVDTGDTGSDTATKESREQEETAKQPEAKPKKPNFKFYEMLPESEVVTPEVEEYTPDTSRQQDFRYLVQTGSFRRQGDAERQRAQIAFQGLRAKIQRIDLDDGGTWYRVNVGPYDSRSQMNSVLDKLVNINIQPLVRKIPKEG
ncbi:MAG: SPOR domain-containing protein [Pseudomonadota bacterium]|nr:SPOR domain-containing protein [Pseudomonadota bacterium]